jgi:hypothetical protein
MFTWRYVLSGDEQAARTTVREVLQRHEFQIEERSADEWRATQGTRPSFWAKMAGDYHEPVVLSVKFAPADGGLGVELHRPVFAAAGGVSRDVRVMEYLDHAYREAAAAVHDDLAAKGILLDSAL